MQASRSSVEIFTEIAAGKVASNEELMPPEASDEAKEANTGNDNKDDTDIATKDMENISGRTVSSYTNAIIATQLGLERPASCITCNITTSKQPIKKNIWAMQTTTGKP